MAEENINEYIDDEIDEGQQQLYEHFRFEVDPGQVATRVDKFMCEKLQHSSRNRIQKAADAGYVHVNDHPVKSNHKVRPGDVVTLMLDRPRFETSIEPEDIPLDIVYEDDDLMVINKPAGMVVHPGCGNFTGTLVNAIAWHLRDIPSYDPNDPQVGLVHRIDKDTSGLLVVVEAAFAPALCPFGHHEGGEQLLDEGEGVHRGVDADEGEEVEETIGVVCAVVAEPGEGIIDVGEDLLLLDGGVVERLVA